MKKYKYELKYQYANEVVNCYIETDEDDINKVKKMGFNKFNKVGFISIENCSICK